MKEVKYLEEEIVIKKATNLLLRELGPIETIRFINMPRKKRIDSVKRHREWQRKLNKGQFFKEIFQKSN
jgi:hypothetical protein